MTLQLITLQLMVKKAQENMVSDEGSRAKKRATVLGKSHLIIHICMSLYVQYIQMNM